MSASRCGHVKLIALVLLVVGLAPVELLWAQEPGGGRIGPEPKTGATKGTPKRKPPKRKPPPEEPPPEKPPPEEPRAPKIEMVLIRAGTFTMGSNNGESDEQPVHRVTISKDYLLGKYEVTQGQWNAVMERSSWRNDELPVTGVSWDDCQEFIRRLNARTGMEFRLPTEAEWEYACRAGTTGDYSGGLEDMAWIMSNSGYATHPVGQKRPNGWGLYDMHGNALEWCQDWYDESYYGRSSGTDPGGATGGSMRVIRGGGAENAADYCRSANRIKHDPCYRNPLLGLRLARFASLFFP